MRLKVLTFTAPLQIVIVLLHFVVVRGSNDSNIKCQPVFITAQSQFITSHLGNYTPIFLETALDSITALLD